MAESLKRWWVREAKTLATPHIRHLLSVSEESDLCLARLRRVMARIVDLESRVAELAVQMRIEKPNGPAREDARQTLPISGGPIPTIPARPLQAS